MDRLLDQLKSFYDGLDAARRKALWVAVAGSLVVVSAVGVWAGQGSTADIVVEPDEVGAAAAAMEEAGISVTRVGNSLRVSTGDYARAEMAIMQVGVVAYEKAPMGASPDELEMWKLRQMQLKIASMLETMDDVAAAQVTLALPDKQNYLVKSREATTGSVVLRLRPGGELNSSQVEVIASVVAGGVKGLKPASVTITDENGTAYQVADQDGTFGSVSTKLEELRLQKERQLEQSVHTALDGVVGPQNMNVTVALELDHTGEDRTVTTYGEPVIRSESIMEQSSQKDAVGGAPGSNSQTPEGRAAKTSGQSSDSQRLMSNYDLPETTVTVAREPGQVERLTATVVVNEDAYLGDDPEAWREGIEKSVQGAVGFDAERGDSIFVQTLPFQEVPMIETAGIPGPGAWTDLVGYGVAALGIVLFFTMVVRPLMKSISEPPAPEEADGTVAGESGETNADADADEGDDLAERLRSLVDNYEAVDAEDLNRLVDRESEAAAQVIRMWSRVS
jgi:flagellar M-ring protein FliF